ncbi:hypothetical protein HMPREF1982_04258 [Clostridiales bacterium oral taxon 876 str. F0540]|nr:hypothetical protein HMPREF1982_04258 [Clostridiales bacterium oral taxon 876 str. F0540]
MKCKEVKLWQKIKIKSSQRKMTVKKVLQAITQKTTQRKSNFYLWNFIKKLY